MRIALKSALMLTTRVIQIINPELHRHMQRTALIALTLASGSAMLMASSADRVERRAVQQRRSLIPSPTRWKTTPGRCLTSPGCT